jgi:hypothetical protein
VEYGEKDFQTFFTNQQGTFQDKVDEILKLPKGKIRYSIITKLVRTFRLSRVNWEERFYVFGFDRITKEFTMNYLHNGTRNNLVRLSEKLRNDNTTLWFAVDESPKELAEWERLIRFVAKHNFNNDIEPAVIDFQKYFANKQKSLPDIVDEILKLPNSKIEFNRITVIAGLFRLCKDDWDLHYSR